MDNNRLYSYRGAVTRRSYLYEDSVITHDWSAQTYAVSEKQARNNLAYRFKILNGLPKNAMLGVPGTFTVED